jgi:hypothetical protein
MPLCGLSCKQRLARFSVKLKFKIGQVWQFDSKRDLKHLSSSVLFQGEEEKCGKPAASAHYHTDQSHVQVKMLPPDRVLFFNQDFGLEGLLPDLIQ